MTWEIASQRRDRVPAPVRFVVANSPEISDMVFNWFRRQKEDSQAPADRSAPPPDAPDSDAATPATDEPEGDPPASDPEPPTVQQDYLAWAKMAYQNLQTQSGTAGEAEPSEPESLEPESVEPETLAPAEALEVETPEAAATETVEVAEPEAAEVTEPESAEVAEVTEPESAEVAEPEAAEVTEPESAEVAEPEATDATETAVETSAPLSFLERAEAERTERLERVRAEAIAEPEPDPDPTPDAPLIRGVQFDADFIWSAEVLAAQGRRPEDISVEEITWLNRLRQGLDKTRRGLVNQLKALVGQGPLNPEAVDEIESLLLQSDAGIEATDAIVEALQAKLREEALPPDAAIAYLETILRDLLDRPWSDRGESYPGLLVPEKDVLNVWLMVGVNGAGKTTTIGKLSHLASKSGYNCLIAAADTFRAAAVEQVKVWGDRAGVDVIANPGQNTDPAAVVYDAIAAARSRNTELLLVDTAGRLQNKKNLMEELGKIRRIIDKQAPEARVEALVVLDATLGQNGLRQASAFAEAANLSGAVLTKLDGTAKGGIALAVAEQLSLPIRFIGAGEGIEDLRPFSSYEFVEALLNG